MFNKKDKSPLPPKKPKNKVEQFSFPDAMALLIGGKMIRRVEWSDQEEYCLMKDSFLMIHRGDKFHQWIVSEGDLLATDWVVK